MDDAKMAAKEALRMLSEYLPAKHQSEKASRVYVAVKAAFDDLERAREPYGPDMSDTAVHISLLETERDGLRLMVADLERQLTEARTEIDRLNGQVAEWSKANLTIVAKCVDLERRLAATAEERDCWKDGGETLAMQVKDLQREVADANGHVAALTAALTTRRSACDEESERADAAERQLAETKAALDLVMRESGAIARMSLQKKGPPG